MLVNKLSLDIHKLCSKDDSRPAMKGVHITSEFTEICDGNLLCRVTHPTADEKEFPTIKGFTPSENTPVPAIIEKKAARDIQRSIPTLKRSDLFSIIGHARIDMGNPDGQVRAVTTNLSSEQVKTILPIDSTFPNTDAVIPKHAADHTVEVNPVYLAKILMLAANHGITIPKVTLEFRAPKDGQDSDRGSIVVKCENAETGQNFYGLLMPMKAKNDDN